MTIPDKIFTYWEGESLSYLHYLTILSLHKLNPEKKITIYTSFGGVSNKNWDTKEHLIEVENSTKISLHKILTISSNIILETIDFQKEYDIPNEISYIHKADITRVIKLYEHGGLWFDFDILFIKKIPETIFSSTSDIIYFSYDDTIATGIIASSCKNSKMYFIYIILLSVLKNIFDGNGYQDLGPTLWLFCLSQPTFKENTQCENTTDIYPYTWKNIKLFFESNNDLVSDNTWGVHWYNGAESSRNFINKKTYKTNTCIEKYIKLIEYKVSEVTCVLNVYKRFENFEEQLNAVLNQSIRPKKIIIWNNNPEVNLSRFASENIIVINSSQNLGVWPRFFSLYYLFSGEYVCVFDDDTIPAVNWLKNCIDTININNALLGTRGVIFNKGNTYDYRTEFGWNGPCDHAKVVDIVGHSWFFRKEWITTIIKELPNIDEEYFVCGEDTHLSYILQKYLNIPTIVPPHPVHDTSLWGSIYEKAMKYGGDKTVAVSHIPGIDNKFTNMLKSYINKGFETINNKADIIKTYSTCLDYFINRIKNKQNFAIMKCADGEYLVSKNQTFTNCDNWTFKADSILNKHFNETLTLMQTNVFYGVSGPSDSYEICDYWYKNIPNTHNITFANVFVNTNFEKWKTFLKNEDLTISGCVLISQVCPENRKLGGMNIIDYLSIDKYLVNNWDSQYQIYFDLISKLSKKYTNTLFFISAGPIANIFVHRMYLENPNNTYIDCGSSIDVFTKGVITRPYQYDKNIYDIPVINLPVVYNNLQIKKDNKIKLIHSPHLGNYIVPESVKNGICVDIGGNTGQFTLKYANFFKIIHIYEPQEECYEIIKENLKKYQHVFLFNEAVFDKSNEEMELISHPNMDSGSVCLNNDKIKVKEWTSNIVNKCKTISLEDILIRVGGTIDYMKIDCETSEYNLLYNKDLSFIKHMGIELSWQVGEENFNNLVNHILKYFNNVYNYNLTWTIGCNIEAYFVSKYL